MLKILEAKFCHFINSFFKQKIFTDFLFFLETINPNF
jgi:hypothetical protein